MIRFATLLQNGFSKANVLSEIWWPSNSIVSAKKNTGSGILKWIGYFEKYISFPFILKRRIKQIQQINPNVKFHICDHSNAPYLKYLPVNHTSITCHDVIAIRGSMGYPDSFQPSTSMGKFLQKWIFGYLKKAPSIAFVSQHTFNQFASMLAPPFILNYKHRVIHNAFNNDFGPMDKVKAMGLLSAEGVVCSQPFILHVGSGSIRKNRSLLLEMGSLLQDSLPLNICFAGEELDKQLLDHAAVLGITNKVVSVVKPNHQILVALYSLCEAFIFPSLSEGFGWPLIEAQACGAVVIASNTAPMPEVSGGAALHFDPAEPKDFADGFMALQNKEFKEDLKIKGFKNIEKFNVAGMAEAYLKLILSK